MFLGGAYQTTTGTYYDTSATVSACDSVTMTSLTVNPAYYVIMQDVEICAGDSALIFGIYQNVSGIYIDSFFTSTGCDSLMSTALVVNSLPVVSISGLDSIYCSTDPGATMIGTPSDGSFAGTGGVAGNSFYPATGIGTYTVVYTYTDSNNCTNSSSQDVSVNNCTGLNQLSISNRQSIIVYPNPTTGTIDIMGVSLVVDGVISIVNILGEEMLMTELTNKINISHLPDGIYFLQIETVNKVIALKVVKQTE